MSCLATNRDSKIRELHRLSEQELLPSIAELDGKRMASIQKLGLALLLMLSGLILHAGSTHGLEPGLAIGLGIIALALLAWGFVEFDSFRKSFKRQVMGRIVQTIFPGFQFESGRSIAQTTYERSQLFQRSYDRYTGEDYCSGQLGQTKIEFSELHTEYKIRTRKGTSWHTIFRGIFIHADFHKELHSKTFVFPDVAEKVLGSWLGGLLQDASTWVDNRGERIRLESPEFERHFSVTSTHPQEARYVLTPVMQEKILQLRQKFRTTPYLSFIDGRVYIAIGEQANFLEPHLLRRFSKEDLFRMFAVFSSFIEIIDDLELNTRIWSKS